MDSRNERYALIHLRTDEVGTRGLTGRGDSFTIVEPAMKNTFQGRFILLALFGVLCSAALCGAASDPVNAALRPPKGAQVALVVFEDLQCPQCRRVAPLLEQASKTYKIPLVRHDFPLPMHNWSYDAAVMERYFDTNPNALANEVRG